MVASVDGEIVDVGLGSPGRDRIPWSSSLLGASTATGPFVPPLLCLPFSNVSCIPYVAPDLGNAGQTWAQQTHAANYGEFELHIQGR
ncbi:hypothetical protein AG1IA_07838 [Rhizoctonia solani AG-1 IA]|uniref:Uncharacterized protein n=1 Tax=Thanatephorus cucumeris (strain AG1-IA) TaxID=983506 RepID=L8WIT5_THACA|nr:hypothetical protein AG1IA_07838 [Rhizoctonia solani AG-1 IA]